MKKYVVLQKIGSFSARSVREFDDVQDANTFAQLMRSSETNEFTQYFVFELMPDK